MSAPANEEGGRRKDSKDESRESEILLIGYGNPLRGDDRLGQEVAEASGAIYGPRLRAIAAHQLTPEMAALLTSIRKVIFVDAMPECDEGVRVRRIDSAPVSESPMTHVCDPAHLLSLGERLYDARPEAWLITIPATDFGWSETLSPLAARGRDQALREVGRIVGG